MSITTFVSEFQDYLFTKRTYLYSLSQDNLSASNIELAFRQTEQILEEFISEYRKQNINQSGQI